MNHTQLCADLGEQVTAALILAKYAQLQAIDQPIAMLRAGTVSYYEADGLGSVTSLTDNVGAFANTYTYGSFGRISASTATVSNPFLYTGREFDNETGLYQYRARYYSTVNGRFLEEDPIGFSGGLNFYAYVRNRALNYIDPFGEQGESGGLDGAPLGGSQTPLSRPKAYNCLAWGLGINDRWIQSYWFEDPNVVPPQFGCKHVDCNKTGNCRRKHRVDVFEDTHDPFNWHVMRQDCDGTWSGKNGQSFLWRGITDPDAFYRRHYPPKGPVKKTCWECPGK